MNSVSESHLVRFGAFELDMRSGELWKSGTRLNLQGQPLQFLTALLERPGKLVTRDELRHRLWPGDTFVDFEHGLNAAVKRLRDALGDSTDTPRFIETVPRRGYRFIAPVETVGGQAAHDGRPQATADQVSDRQALQLPGQPESQPRRARWGIVIFTTGILVLALAGVWLLRLARATPGVAPPMRVVALTAMNGFEVGSISADGRQVVFQWDGDAQDNTDIYIKLVGSSEMRRLTTDPAADLTPVWSPDAREIAYIRQPALDWSSPRARLRVMSSLGGSDRQVSDLPISFPAAWSPDGRYLLAGRASPPDAVDPSNGIYLIPVQGGEPRAITRPKAPEFHQAPSFSPDGHRLAYVSCQDASHLNCRLYVLDMDSTFMAAGPPRPVTPNVLPTTINGVCWSRDGTSIIYGATKMDVSYLWRVGVDAGRPPERIEMAGAGAIFPSAAHAGDRLMFSRHSDDVDIYRFESGRSAEPVARSSAYDGNVQFSPDGRRIAFCSLRSEDSMEVWVANADGSTPVQLTHGPNREQCSPTWSADGLEIAFDSQSPDGSWHIWTVDSEGGSAQQVTKDPGDQNHPTWSRDGLWIYFSWKQSTERDFWRRDVWRTRRQTGVKEQITKGGTGVVGRESADGTMVLYQPKVFSGPLLAQSLHGGTHRSIIACVTGTAVAVTKAGIYYVACEGAFPSAAIVRLMDPVTGKDREVGRLERYRYEPSTGAFTVSPDGRTFLYERLLRSGVDLMMIDNFR